MKNQRGGREGRRYLFKLVRESGPCKLIKLRVYVPNWVQRPVRGGSSEMNNV